MIVEISYSGGSFAPLTLAQTGGVPVEHVTVTPVSVKVYVEGISVAEWDRYWVPFLRSLRGANAGMLLGVPPAPSPESPFTRRIEI